MFPIEALLLQGVWLDISQILDIKHRLLQVHCLRGHTWQAKRRALRLPSLNPAISSWVNYWHNRAIYVLDVVK